MKFLRKRIVVGIISAAILIAGVLAVIIFSLPDQGAALQATGTSSQSFSDMPATGHWSTKALQSAVDNGLLRGNAGKLNPAAPITRAEMATIINRAFGAEKTTNLNAFSDVDPSAWYYPEMSKAAFMKTFRGSGTQLRPLDTVTRQEAFTVLSRALSMRAAEPKALNAYMDRSEIADWAVGSLSAMTEAGYISGTNGLLHPKAQITREEFAQVMEQVGSWYITQKGVYCRGTYDGNVIILVPGVTLRNMTIRGHLVLAEGVGEGCVTLRNVTVEGRLIVRGGGINSVKLLGDTTAGEIVVSKLGGSVRICRDKAKSVVNVTVKDGALASTVILDGALGDVNVEASNLTVACRRSILGTAKVTGQSSSLVLDRKTTAYKTVLAETAHSSDIAADGRIYTAEVSANDAEVQMNKHGSVSFVKVAKAASETTIQTIKGAKISTVDTAGTNTKVAGEGKVRQAIAENGADGVHVNTLNTLVTAQMGARDVWAGKLYVLPGTSVKVGSSCPCVENEYSTYSLAIIVSDNSSPVRMACIHSNFNLNRGNLLTALSVAAEGSMGSDGELNRVFNGESDLYAIMVKGLEAYHGTDAEWRAFVDFYQPQVIEKTSGAWDILTDEQSKFRSVKCGVPYTLIYTHDDGKTYTLTVCKQLVNYSTS